MVQNKYEAEKLVKLIAVLKIGVCANMYVHICIPMCTYCIYTWLQNNKLNLCQ